MRRCRDGNPGVANPQFLSSTAMMRSSDEPTLRTWWDGSGPAHNAVPMAGVTTMLHESASASPVGHNGRSHSNRVRTRRMAIGAHGSASVRPVPRAYSVRARACSPAAPDAAPAPRPWRPTDAWPGQGNPNWLCSRDFFRRELTKSCLKRRTVRAFALAS